MTTETQAPIVQAPVESPVRVPVEAPVEPAPRASGPGRPRWLVALAITLSVITVAVAWQVVTWPEVGALATEAPKSTAFIDRFVARERAAGRKTRADQRWVPYAAISNELKRAVIVAEDIEFFSHDGFSRGEIEEAMRTAWEEGELPRGASTLTQQLAKNLYLSPSRNPWRKVKEALLTGQLERRLTKRRILELYLNVVEFGPGLYGAEAASRRYFGKAAADLGPEEAAALAGVLPKPSSWRPDANSKVYRSRVARIARRAADARWLDREL
jgi:monofunctional biosynthetic peptidoglycan transglycosylase